MCEIIKLAILSPDFPSSLLHCSFNIFSLSFDEGSALQFMEVVTTEPIKAFQSDAALQQYYYCKSDGTHSYRLAFRRRTDLDALVSEYEFDNRVQNLEARYCSVGL